MLKCSSFQESNSSTSHSRIFDSFPSPLFLSSHKSPSLTYTIGAVILSGSHAGKEATIPRITLDTPQSSGLPFILSRRQFALRLAYSMTINKSQGQSLGRVGIVLTNQVCPSFLCAAFSGSEPVLLLPGVCTWPAIRSAVASNGLSSGARCAGSRCWPCDRQCCVERCWRGPSRGK